MIENISYRKEEGAFSPEDEPPLSHMHKRTLGLNKEHRYQIPDTGWCAQAQLQMLHIISGDLEKTQEEIALTLLKDGKTLFDPNWGTSHERLEEYLDKNWSVSGAEADATWERIEELVDQGFFVIANVMGLDNMENGEVDKGGHYIRIKSYDKTKNEVEIYDSSNGVRPDGKNGIYTLRAEVDFSEDEESVDNMYALDHYFWDYPTAEAEKEKDPMWRWIAYADPLTFKFSVTSQQVATI